MWSDLPKNLKTVLGVAILGALCVAAAAFRLSFVALREVAEQPGLKFGVGNAWLLPIILDAALVVCEVILLGASMVRVRNRRGELEQYDRTVPFLLVVIFGAATIYFNVTRVPAELRPVTVLPPAASILMTVALAYLMKMLARISGADHIYEAPSALEPKPIVRKADVLEGEIVRGPDTSDGGYVMLPQVPPEAAKNQQALPPNGQNGTPDGAVPGGRAADQRAKVEAYLDALQANGRLDRSVTGRQVAQATGVSLRTAQPILAEYKALLGIPSGNNGGAKPSRRALHRRR